MSILRAYVIVREGMFILLIIVLGVIGPSAVRLFKTVNALLGSSIGISDSLPPIAITFT